MNKTQILQFLKQDSESCIIGTGEHNIPIVSCWRIDFYHIGFWCPDCNVLHRHGWSDGKPNGHRSAHCHNSNSRFNRSGYYLVCQGNLINREVKIL